MPADPSQILRVIKFNDHKSSTHISSHTHKHKEDAEAETIHHLNRQEEYLIPPSTTPLCTAPATLMLSYPPLQLLQHSFMCVRGIALPPTTLPVLQVHPTGRTSFPQTHFYGCRVATVARHSPIHTHPRARSLQIAWQRRCKKSFYALQ